MKDVRSLEDSDSTLLEKKGHEDLQAKGSLASETCRNLDDSLDATATKPSETWCEFFLSELRPDLRLVPLKILAFFFYGGMYSVVPYFTLHMRQVGLSIKEMAVIYSVLPLPAIVGPIISGMIADRTAKFKAVLMVNIVLALVLTLWIAFISPLEGAGDASLEFNTTGVALSRIDCRPAAATLQDLTCSSSCLSENLDPMPYGSYAVACAAVDVTKEIPLQNCVLPAEGDPECGRDIKFSPPLAKVMPYKVHRDNDVFIDKNCTFYCRKAGDDDPFLSTEMSNSKTFWLYFVLRVTGMLFIKSSFSMMDASIMAVMLKTGGDYGKQRLVAMLSMATFPFIASCIVQALSGHLARADYTPVFYFSACLLLVSLAVCVFVDLEVKHKAEGNVLKNVKKLISRSEVIIFLIIIFLLGLNWGFIEQYLFVYLETLNAPPYLLGLTLTFGCLTGVPMLLVSDRIIERIGRQRVFFIGFLAYTVRMFGYSFISNPWYCFIFEALEVFTYQIMWVAAVTFFPILAPKGLLGTMTGMAGAVHYNVGRGGGGFFGGLLIANIGMVWSFRVFGLTSFFFAFFYLFLQKTVLKSTLLNDKKPAETRASSTKSEEILDSPEP